MLLNKKAVSMWITQQNWKKAEEKKIGLVWSFKLNTQNLAVGAKWGH